MGDSGYDCNYCHGKNHLAKECMLRRMNEKKEGADDEAYYMRKLEETTKKNSNGKSMPVLIVQENVKENEFGGVEIWCTDSEDEEVRKPTHGRAVFEKEEGSEFDGKCLMVTNGVSQV